MSSEVKSAINNLIKILSIFRRTSPFHNLSDEERKEVISTLNDTIEKLKKVKEAMENENTEA